jgi:hypothetical protein
MLRTLALAVLTLSASPAAAACLSPPCDYTGEWMPGDPFDSSYLPETPYDPANEARYDDVAQTWTAPDGTVTYVGNAGQAGVVLVAVSDGDADPVSRPDGALMPKGTLRLRQVLGLRD